MYNLYKRISRNYFLLIVICILSGYGTVKAQDNAKEKAPGFSGMVIDQYGNPLSGVEVSVKSTGLKIVSDENGIFRYDPVLGNVVILSHPQFLTKEIKLPESAIQHETDADGEISGSVFKVRLADKKIKDTQTLDVLYGTADKRSYLGSAATIYTNQLNTTLSSNIIASFAGRFPGLFTTQEKGMRSPLTGDNFEKDIFVGNRPKFGLTGYGDNTEYKLNSRDAEVIVLIDGVQREFYSLDPENIESISIQKDALSAISLGMRSSRSVLLITTKKPVEQGFQISFTGKFGIQKPIGVPNALSADKYAYLLNEAMQNDGKPAIYSLEDFEKYRNHSSPYTHPDINWFDAVMKDYSTIQSYNLNATGGGKVAQYYVGLGYMEEDGLFKSSKVDNYETNARYQRYLITSRINVNVTNEFKVGVSLMGRIEDGNQPGATSAEILKNIFETANNAYPITNPNGTFGGNTSYKENLMAQTRNSGYIKDNRRDGMAAITLDYNLGKFVKGLSARAQGNITTQSVSAIQRSKKDPVYQFKPSTGPGVADTYDRFGNVQIQNNNYKSVGNYQQMYGQIGLNYITTLGLHTIGGSAFADLQEELLNYDLPRRPANLNAKANYNYDMKYFAEAAISRGYYNRYRPGKRWGTFYAFGLGWDISRENFFNTLDWLNQFKVRAVYGNTGNGVDNSGYYTWRQTYKDDGNSYPMGYEKSNGGSVRELEDKLVNRNITWEKAHKLNVGTDISLFANRLQFTADLYRDEYYDLLQARGKSIELIGLKYPDENIGKRLMTGAELSVTYQDNIGDFNYFVTANWSRQKTEVKFMDEQHVQEDYQRLTGRPAGVWMGYIADGFFQSEEEIKNSPVMSNFTIRPGDIKYKDMNGDGVVDEYDKTVIGNDKPLSYFGFNLGFEFKGFELSALIQGAYNRDIYLDAAGASYVQPFIGKDQAYGQAYELILNRWTPETANTATFPRLSAGANIGFGLNTYNTNPGKLDNRTSFWVKSGNYIRLKNVYAAYTLPDSFSRNYLGGVRVKLFVSGQNLLTKAAYNDLDPEVLGFSNSPNLRGFNTGINIKF